MKVPMAAVICCMETPMALAFSRSIVDGDLRVVGGEGRVEAGELGAGSARLAHHRVHDAVDVAEACCGPCPGDELEAADGADALDGGRLKGSDDAARDAEELGRNLGDDVVRGVAFAEPGAVIDRVERGEDEAGSWGWNRRRARSP